MCFDSKNSPLTPLLLAK